MAEEKRAEEIRDRLAERIAARRAELAQTRQPLQGVHEANPATSETRVNPIPQLPLNPTLMTKIREAREAIAAGENPIKTAMMLSAILAGGVKRKEVIEGIAKSDAWLSKRLGLLKATKDIQRLIEVGELSEREYYNNRPNISSGIKGRGELLRYQRMPTITIGIEAARAIASILQELAAQQGAAPIHLNANTNKKDLTGILNLRAGEIRGMLKS